jgi:hypothetical protein
LPGNLLNILQANGVGLAYFLGSQKELRLARLRGEAVEGKPDSDLDLGIVLLEHPLDYWEGQWLRQRLEYGLAPLFAPCACISCFWKKKTPTSNTLPSGVCKFMPSMRVLPAGIAARSWPSMMIGTPGGLDLQDLRLSRQLPRRISPSRCHTFSPVNFSWPVPKAWQFFPMI